MRSVILFALLAVSALPAFASTGAATLPWLEHVGVGTSLQDIRAISTGADVTVSDGLTYRATTVFHHSRLAAFRREYIDRTEAEGVEGTYVWSFDGKAETETSPFMGHFVLGHQIHAQILFFDHLHGGVGAPAAANFAGRECLAVAGTDQEMPWRFYFAEDGRPLGMSITRENEPDITMVFDAWRPVADISLPFIVDIDDGTREFRYEYTTVALNEGDIAEFRAPVEMLTEQQMLARQRRIEGMKEGEAGVRAAVAAFGRAFAAADVTALETLLAEDYIHVNGGSGGVIDRESWLGWIATRRAELESGALVIGDYRVEDLRVEMYGETAVVTGLVSSDGTRNGESFASRVRFTNAWVRQEGVWRRAAFHDSRLPANR